MTCVRAVNNRNRQIPHDQKSDSLMHLFSLITYPHEKSIHGGFCSLSLPAFVCKCTCQYIWNLVLSRRNCTTMYRCQPTSCHTICQTMRTCCFWSLLNCVAFIAICFVWFMLALLFDHALPQLWSGSSGIVVLTGCGLGGSCMIWSLRKVGSFDVTGTRSMSNGETTWIRHCKYYDRINDRPTTKDNGTSLGFRVASQIASCFGMCISGKSWKNCPSNSMCTLQHRLRPSQVCKETGL